MYVSLHILSQEAPYRIQARFLTSNSFKAAGISSRPLAQNNVLTMVKSSNMFQMRKRHPQYSKGQPQIFKGKYIFDFISIIITQLHCYGFLANNNPFDFW